MQTSGQGCFRLSSLAIAAALGAMVVSCALSHEKLSGRRSDGLMVVCNPDGPPDQYACDPQDEDNDGGIDESGSGSGTAGTGGVDAGAGSAPGSGPGGGSGDGTCDNWVNGGPAIMLWPPNHKMYTIGLSDCARVRSACAVDVGAAAAGHVVAVTSDEPLEVGAGGDGMTPTGDMDILDGRTVALRSERQGGSDGRVYRVELVDAAGATDVCEVHVPHDMGPYGGAHDSGEAVRITAGD